MTTIFLESFVKLPLGRVPIFRRDDANDLRFCGQRHSPDTLLGTYALADLHQAIALEDVYITGALISLYLRFGAAASEDAIQKQLTRCLAEASSFRGRKLHQRRVYLAWQSDLNGFELQTHASTSAKKSGGQSRRQTLRVGEGVER
jgi:hypothetical protein